MRLGLAYARGTTCIVHRPGAEQASRQPNCGPNVVKHFYTKKGGVIVIRHLKAKTRAKLKVIQKAKAPMGYKKTLAVNGGFGLLDSALHAPGRKFQK